ncbi:hypothetical protein [Pseudaquabacterium pictum]|uniref:Uncharacterized protein n=1 Tax=Pseudaquabacterium pictum TaxID=2315236 RepID=A0A480AIE8_9BURK|nr:hypothetical protein [Rubrivivax pictus]GCL61519.1 hypothetical protein AQPW35_06000 [Rubrivivax pictus]
MHPTDPSAGHQVASPPQQPAAAAAQPTPQIPQMWAIVELMGHQRVAGTISHDLTFGAPLMRVDVPEVVYLDSVWRNGAFVDVERRIPAHSRSVGHPAVFTIHWVDEATARLAAVQIKASPLKLISLHSALDSVPEAERQALLQLTRSSALIAADDAGDNDGPL